MKQSNDIKKKNGNVIIRFAYDNFEGIELIRPMYLIKEASMPFVFVVIFFLSVIQINQAHQWAQPR